jgi:archaeal flagellar protein FlaI
MMFKKGAKLYSYELHREGGETIVYVNYLGSPFVPSIASYPEVMGRVVDLLISSSNISRVILVQQKNYNYSFDKIKLLLEIAQVYNSLLKEKKILSLERISSDPSKTSQRHSFLSYFINLLRQDPVSAYAKVKMELSEEKVQGSDFRYINLLEDVISLLEKTELISKVNEKFDSVSSLDRKVYDDFFSPDIIPNFAFARLVANLPSDAKILSQYKIGPKDDESVVTILKEPQELKPFYHVMPPEYFLNEDFQNILNLARNVLIEHQPKAEEFIDPERTRQVFFNVARDLVRELAETNKLEISYDDLSKLAKILVRHTIGFGLLEVLLQDDKLQDIVLNAPISLSPIFVRHSNYDECSTNILLSQEDANSWAAKFRMISGRPLDESNPVLDTDLNLEYARARISVVQRPLSPNGLSYAFRRHRDYPWTLPLFIKYKMLNSFAAGLLSFLIDGSRTMLIAGTRSSGKTSLLGSLMLEIKPKFRIILIEDTLELPSDYFRKLEYDILSMKVKSSLSESETEISAEDGIRTSLRLGDSALIIGEIRSNEAKALYEAMRVGALANVVAGTVHGSSPYSVFDRIVNDLNVPITSFKATDLIVVANPVKTPDGLHSVRRVVQVSEVRKHWTKDPLDEKGFVDLLKYNVETDQLEPTDDLINGNSEIIKEIASQVKGWAGDWDAVYDNILLRGKIKEEIVKISEKLNKPEILEAKFCHMANSVFHEISEEVTKDLGLPKGDVVFNKWKKIIDKEATSFKDDFH